MKRLLCISERFYETEEWYRSMGLSRHDVMHQSRHINPHKMRGLSEDRTAIVWINGDSGLRLSADHKMILEMYISLGVPQFFGMDRDKIREWLYGPSWVKQRERRKLEREVAVRLVKFRRDHPAFFAELAELAKKES